MYLSNAMIAAKCCSRDVFNPQVLSQMHAYFRIDPTTTNSSLLIFIPTFTRCQSVQSPFLYVRLCMFRYAEAKL